MSTFQYTGAIVEASSRSKDGNTYRTIVISADGSLIYFAANEEAFKQAEKLLLAKGTYILTVSARSWQNRTTFTAENIAPVK